MSRDIHRALSDWGREMTNAATIAKSLRGIPSGSGWLCKCPVSSHGKGQGDRHPSLTITDGYFSLLVHCFAGCNPSDILDALRRRGLVDEQAATSGSFLETRPRNDRVPAPIAADPAALRLWRDASPIAGTLGERYLAARGLKDAPASLRFLASAEYMAGRVYLPAMIAAVQAPDRRIIAAQLTFLATDGTRKASVATPRRTIGALGAGAVRLGYAGEALGIAEGVETGLAAMKLTGVPCWASLGAMRMHRVAIPDGVNELHIFADDDETGRGAAERVAAANTHRTVVTRFPPAGFSDYNDVLMRELVDP